MKNKGSKGWRKWLSLLMVLCVLGLHVFSAGGNVAYADDEVDQTESEEKSLGSGNNNAFSTENATYIEAYKSAADYSIAMQYAVTYSILSSQYGDGTKYGGLYKGDKSSVSGVVSQSFPVDDNFIVQNFGGLNLYEQITSGDSSDGASFENEGELSSADKNYLKTLEEEADKLADELAEEYAAVIAQYIGLTDKRIEAAEIADSTIEGWVLQRERREIPRSWLTVSSRDEAVNVPDKAERALVAGLKPQIKTALMTAPSEKDITKSTGAGLTVDMITKAVKSYRDSLTTHGASVKYEPSNSKHIYVINDRGDNNDVSRDNKKKYVNDYIRYVSESMSDSVQKAGHLKDLNKALASATTKAFKEIDKDSYNKYVKALKKKLSQGADAVASSSNYTVMAWLPLLVTYAEDADIIKGGGTDGGYLKALEGFDGSKLNGTNLVTSSGEPRAVRVNDLFADKSSSPVFTYDTDKYNNASVMFKVGANGQISKQSLGTYLGMKGTSKWDISLGNLADGNIQSSNVKAAQPTKNDTYAKGLMKAITANPGDLQNFKTNSTDTVGIDNYGNIIVGSTGVVLIPYWQNDMVLDMSSGDGAFISSAIFNNKDADGIAKAMKKFVGTDSGNNVKALEKTASLANVSPSVREQVKRVQEALPNGGNISFEKMNQFMGTGDVSVFNTPSDTARALAMLITAATSDEVRAWTEQFIEDAEKSKEMYIDLGTAGFSSGDTAAEDLNRWDAARLIERIGMVFDVGFYETLRLTIASWVVSLYNSSFINYSVNAIFHTTTIADSGVWGTLVSSLGLLLIGFMAVYLMIMAFKVFRKTLTFKEFARNFIMVSLIIVIPAALYSPLIHYTINKPADFIIGKQLEQTSLLDTWLYMESKERERDENYAKLFGGKDQLRDRSQDYLIYFYTTTHRNGFDIDNIDESTLSMTDQIRKSFVEDGGRWNKDELVRIGVSIYDLFDWAQERYNNDTQLELFQWLETTRNTNNAYDGVGSYREYHFDTSTKFDELAVANGIKNAKGIDISASELYLMLVETTRDKGVLNSLNSLYNVANAVRNPVGDTVITPDEQEALLRDLSMTVEGRRSLYGSSENPFSIKSETLMQNNQFESKPESDFLALNDLVQQLAPYRDMTTTTLDRDIYEINRALLDEYMFTYSVVRDNATNTLGSFQEAELRMVLLSTFFTINKELGLYAFPTSYEASTVSFDNYVRMAFIPMQSFDTENVDIDNVAQYLSLRENPMVLFVFLTALFALLVFGLTYLAVFYFAMMLLMLVAFVKNYVVNKNSGNKSWLGSLVIIGTFALAKIGLLTLWYLMSYYLNYSTGRAGGITYPYTLIHSILIIVYVFLVMKFVFMKVFRAVLKDKENLGGEIFSNGFSRMMTDLKNAPSLLRGGFGKSANTAGNALKNALNKEGAAGTVSGKAKSGLQRGLKRGLGLGRRAGYGALGYFMTKSGLEHAVASIGSKLQDGGSGVKEGFATSYVGRLLKHMNRADGGAFKAIAQEYYNTDKSVSGLSVDGLTDENIGEVVAAGGASYMTMALDTEEQAKQLEEHLKDQGIKAVRDYSTVSFETTGKDFQNSAGVRKQFLGGLVDRAVAELEDLPKPKRLSGLEDTLNYSTYTVDENGNSVNGYKIDIGASGISPEGLEKIMNTPTFAKNFKLAQPIERDSMGNYLPGTAMFEYVGKKNGAVEVAKLFEQDATHRETLKLDPRVASGLADGLDLGSQSSEVTNQVQNLLVKGMQYQDGKVLYNEKNRFHRQAIKNINEQVLSNIDEVRNGKLDLSQKISAYVVNGGNHGYTTEHFKRGDDGSSQMFQKLGVNENLQYEKIFAGKENAAKDVQTIQNLKSIVNLNGSDVRDYVTAQKDMLTRANRQVLGDKNDYANGVASMLAYVKKAGIEGVLDNHEEKFSKLVEDRENNNLSDASFSKEVKELFGDMQKTLKDNGKLEGFASDKLERAMSQEDRDSLTKFRDIREDLVKNKAADSETLSKFDFNTYADVTRVVNNISGIKSDESSVLTVESVNGDISQEGLGKILERYRK